MHRAPFIAVPIATAVLTGILLSGSFPRRAEAAWQDDNRFPYRFKTVASMRAVMKDPWNSFFVADVDLDGNDDLLVNEETRLLWYKLDGDTMRLAGEGAYEDRGRTRFLADANGDGRPEFFVSTQETRRSMLSCHDWFSPAGPSAPLYTIGPILSPQKIEVTGRNKVVYFGCFAARMGDRSKLCLGVITGRYEQRPRALVAYDNETGAELWEFELAPQPVELTCGVLGRSDRRVLLSTAGSTRDIEHDGMMSDQTYLYCLDERNGALLWKKEAGGYGGRCSSAIGDLDGDGSNEAVLVRDLASSDSLHGGEGDRWSVMSLDADGKTLSSVELPAGVRSVWTRDLDRDGRSEVLVDGIEGDFFLLNYDLTIRHVRKCPWPEDRPKSDIAAVVDFIEDERPEILCLLGKMLMVRDSEGVPVAVRDYEKSVVRALPVRCGGRVLVAAGGGDGFFVMTLERTPFRARLAAHAQILVLGTLGAGLVGTWATFHARRLAKRRRERGISLDEAHSELLKAMAAYSHGGSSLKVVDRLRLHLKNWDRIQAGEVTREELFAKLRETYVETVVPEINHIVMLARKARVPEGIWGSLRAEAAFAAEETSEILAAGSGGDAHRSPHITKALGALDAVDGSLAAIRAHLRSIFRTPVGEALGRLVARFRDEHGPRGVSFALVSDAAETDDAFIFPVTFDKIFESLLSNAVRASEACPAAEIAVAVEWEGNYCRIDVRDNGCGIPRDDWERVFDRHYTTKTEGGGFGLYYAREELAKFGGKIYVSASDEGSGTVMRVVLRRSEKRGGA